jgi:tetratricopeptide (TPR) repeat protein
MAAEARAVRAISFEEDFLNARLVYQSLAVGSAERAPLRRKLFDYLLTPVATLNPDLVRKEVRDSSVSDHYDRIVESFKDALELVAPEELWGKGAPRLDEVERSQLAASARMVRALYAPRGNETAVAMALFVLATLEPKNGEWVARLDELLPWVDRGAQLAVNGGGPRQTTTLAEALEAVSASWPAPLVAQRLGDVYLQRQERLARALRRPIGTGEARSAALGEILLEGDAIQATAVNLACLYLRPGQLEAAAEALAKVAQKPGDDPDLRALVSAAARSGAPPQAYLALARRLLPRHELLGGTSSDRLDPAAALAILQRGLARHPTNVELLVLASRVARFVPAPYLALRYIEDARAVLEKTQPSSEELATVSAELVELSFTRLRTRIDPEHIEPATREAEALRALSAEARRRFGEEQVKISEADIDSVLARGLVDAGMPDRAETLFLRAQKVPELSAEVAVELATLAQKRGDAARAVVILRDALERHQSAAPAQETIGFVEAQSKLARNLGNALEAAGEIDHARRAWTISLRGWERLMVEHLRRKTLTASSEATLEVGRLYYLLGKQTDGIQKFGEAIEQNEGRDQSYIDTLAFLVQRGETDAALDVYRRAMGKPSRTVSEYVKIYASLWIMDLTRRAGRAPDQAAEDYLRALDARRVHLRPPRASAWYLQLAKFAIGRASYDELLPKADTTGKRAELYFYEAMRRLAAGRRDDAHSLWTKVIETKMFSFFEYEMASRYLRVGAPSQAAPAGASEAEAI